MFNEVLIGTQAAVMGLATYQTGISVAGMLTRSTVAPHSDHKSKFALVVCAHNEEKVVGQIVKNLQDLDYPKERYSIYVICDNCTDNTASVVKQHGGHAMERHVPELKGKGHGLEWMFAQLDNSYDAVIIFDADNLASTNYLMEMNNTLNAGNEVAQAYLDSKNPHDTWITRSYAFSYWATNRIYQLARDNLGLSAQLGGTGLMVSTRILRELGWGSTSLTEDLEFTIKYVLQGGRVAWVNNAKVYDEKPLKMKASWKQRIRWMQGHMSCMIDYSWPMIKSMFKGNSLIKLDALVYLVQPTRMFVSILMLGFWAASFFGLESGELSSWIWMGMLAAYYAVPLIGLIVEGKGKHILWAIPAYIFSWTWLPITAIGFWKRKEKVWVSTEHTRGMTADEIAS